MVESRDQWSSHNEPFNRAYNGRVQYSAHASQLETQRIDDSVDFSSTGRRMADRHLTYTQQGQHVELESYPNQHVPREVANYRVGSAQENAVFAISETNHACGTTEHGCHLSMPVPWCQEGNFPYQQPSPFYSRQQPEADIGSSSHHQNRDGSNNNFIADPSVAANDEPCSTYNTLDGSQDTHHPKQTQVWAEQNILEATYSMFTHDDPGSVYPNHNGLETPISNVLPEHCPYSFQPSAPMYRMNIPTSSCRTSSKSPLGRAHAPASKLSPSCKRENSPGRVPSLRKTGGHGNSYHSHQGRRLAPPMQRRVSSASSQNTEATSSSAISDHALEVLTCPVANCGVAFSGKFQKGNKKRHMRAKHSGKNQIKCGDCSRSFGRSDALLKHSRKQHPKGAADILPKSCSKGTSLRDEY